MLIILLTAHDNGSNKRAYVKLGHDCTVRVVWCDRAYDPTQLDTGQYWQNFQNVKN